MTSLNEKRQDESEKLVIEVQKNPLCLTEMVDHCKYSMQDTICYNDLQTNTETFQKEGKYKTDKLYNMEELNHCEKYREFSLIDFVYSIEEIDEHNVTDLESYETKVITNNDEDDDDDDDDYDEDGVDDDEEEEEEDDSDNTETISCNNIDEISGDRKQEALQKIIEERHVLDDTDDESSPLPSGWLKVMHISGVPLYHHKVSNVCTLSRPYSVGPQSCKSHLINKSAIPCLKYIEQRRKFDESTETICDFDPVNELSKDVSKFVYPNISEDNCEDSTIYITNDTINDKVTAVNDNVQTTVLRADDLQQNNCKLSESKVIIKSNTIIKEMEKGHDKQSFTNQVDNQNEDKSLNKVNQNILPVCEGSFQSLDMDNLITLKFLEQNNEILTDRCDIENVCQSNNTQNMNTIDDKDICNENIGKDMCDDNENTGKDICDKNESTNKDTCAENENVDDTCGVNENIHKDTCAENENIDKDVCDVNENTNKDMHNKNKNTDKDMCDENKSVDKGMCNENENNDISDENTNNTTDKNTDGIQQPGNSGNAPKVDVSNKRKRDYKRKYVDEHAKEKNKEIFEYYHRLFTFQKIKYMKFKSWDVRRTYTRSLRHERSQRWRKPGSLSMSIPIYKWDNVTQRIKKENWYINPKEKSFVGILHEYLQQTLKTQPTYKFKELENAKTPYSATIVINNTEYGVGVGKSKKEAKILAAKNTMEVLLPDFKCAIDLAYNLSIRPSSICNTVFTSQPDNTVFDHISITDPQIPTFSLYTAGLTPYELLQKCIQSKYSDKERVNIHYTVDIDKCTMSVREHTVSIACSNKREGKQKASQALLQLLHPYITNWGSLLRLYSDNNYRNDTKNEIPIDDIMDYVDNGPDLNLISALRVRMQALEEKNNQIETNSV